MLNIKNYEKDYAKHLMMIKINEIKKRFNGSSLLNFGCGIKDVFNDMVNFPLIYSAYDIALPKTKIFLEKSYDNIICFEVLEEVDNVEESIHEIISCLSEDGIIFISVPNAYSVNRIVGSCNGYMDTPVSLTDGDLKEGHKRMGGWNYWRTLLNAYGLKISEEIPIGYKPVDMNTMKCIEKYWDQFDNIGNKLKENCAELMFVCGVQ